MCGIISIIRKNNSKINYPVSSLFHYAYANRHRGENDGFGAIIKSQVSDNSEENMRIINSLLQLSEVQNNKLTNKPKHKEREDEVPESKLKKQLDLIDKIQRNNLSFGVFHHRHATCGIDISLDNTHPFKIEKGIYYVHNGSVFGTEFLRNYLEYEEKENFRTDLDSEVISRIAENYLKRFEYSDNAFKTVKNHLSMMIPQQFGVLVRIDIFNNKIDIIKDDNRSLFYIEQEGYHLIVSEVLHGIKDPKRVLRLNSGVFSLNKNEFKSYTNLKESITPVNIPFKKAKQLEPQSNVCDFCNNTKNTYSLDCGYIGVHICLNCFLTDNTTTIKVENKKDRVMIQPPFELQEYKKQSKKKHNNKRSNHIIQHNNTMTKNNLNNKEDKILLNNYDSPKINGHLPFNNNYGESELNNILSQSLKNKLAG